MDGYKRAIKVKPDYAEAYNNMGTALKEKGDLDAVIENYKQVIKIKPDYAEAKHLLASLIGETTSSATREFVENLFDNYVSKFDHSLVDKLEYKVPKIITEMIVKN